MKLLDKKIVAVEKSSEKKREIDEGMKLAKSVDALREAHAKEQANLKKFRDESLKAIKTEISSYEAERNDLKREVAFLKEEKLKAEAPVDLTDEWKKVRALKQELFDRESNLISREALVHNLGEREKVIKAKEQEIEKYLEEIREGYVKSQDLKFEIERQKNESDIFISQNLSTLDKKEKELISREVEVNRLKEEIASDRKKLLDHETNLVQRESKVEAQIRNFFDRDEALKEEEALTKRYNDEAVKNYDASENMKIQIRTLKDEAEKDINERYESLLEKEKNLGYRERDFVLEREKVENDRKLIEKEKLHIASQQETLRQAWQNIKNLNNK